MFCMNMSEHNYALRPARSEDEDVVYDIYMHPSVVPFLGFDPMPRGDFRMVFRQLMDNDSLHVVEMNGQVAGFVKFNRQHGRAAHVATLGPLAISPSYHGSGLAGTMVRDAIDMLSTDGVTRVELLVEADNPRGLAFYRKLGFEYEGTMRQAYRRASDSAYVDEFVLAKLLRSEQHGQA
jgi:putative acetyltransferase